MDWQEAEIKRRFRFSRKVKDLHSIKILKRGVFDEESSKGETLH